MAFRNVVRRSNHLGCGKQWILARTKWRRPCMSIPPVNRKGEPPISLRACYDANRSAGILKNGSLLNVQFEMSPKRESRSCIARAGDVSQEPMSFKFRSKSHIRIMTIAQVPGFLDRNSTRPDARRTHGFGESGPFLAKKTQLAREISLERRKTYLVQFTIPTS